MLHFYKKEHKKYNCVYLIFVITAFLLIILGAEAADKAFFPAAEEITRSRCTALINKKIDEITENIIKDSGIDYRDFYETSSKDGEITQITVNSILINSICSRTARELSACLSDPKETETALPLGMLTGVRLLSAIGPNVKVRLLPIGSADCDYESRLKESGINRINYTIYMNIKTRASIVCPFSSQTVDITRKYVLVDTVFSGTVPEYYLNLPK